MALSTCPVSVGQQLHHNRTFDVIIEKLIMEPKFDCDAENPMVFAKLELDTREGVLVHYSYINSPVPWTSGGTRAIPHHKTSQPTIAEHIMKLSF